MKTELYYDLERLRTLSDSELEGIWAQKWWKQEQICHAFQDLRDAIDEVPHSGRIHEAVNAVCYCLESEFPGGVLAADGRDFIREEPTEELKDFWFDFHARRHVRKDFATRLIA